MMITVSEAMRLGLCPAELRAADGEIIDRLVTAFDMRSGAVESYITDDKGNFVHGAGEIRRRVEVFPAPLTMIVK